MMFQGKTAIVTGGAGYIGGAIVRRLLENGAEVVVFDIARGEVQTDDSRQAHFISVDLTDYRAVQAAVEKTVEEVGAPDMLVTSAGGSARERMRPFAEQEMEVVRQVIEMNLFGALNANRAVVPHMLDQGGGRIVNIGSIVALRGAKGCVDYAAAKGGIIAATKAMAMELSPRNILVNCVSPGLVQRPDAQPASPLDFARQHSYVNRLCLADDVANLVQFLLSPQADYITGQNYIIDGGRSLGLKGSH